MIFLIHIPKRDNLKIWGYFSLSDSGQSIFMIWGNFFTAEFSAHYLKKYGVKIAYSYCKDGDNLRTLSSYHRLNEPSTDMGLNLQSLKELIFQKVHFGLSEIFTHFFTQFQFVRNGDKFSDNSHPTFPQSLHPSPPSNNPNFHLSTMG